MWLSLGVVELDIEVSATFKQQDLVLETIFPSNCFFAESVLKRVFKFVFQIEEIMKSDPKDLLALFVQVTLIITSCIDCQVRYVIGRKIFRVQGERCRKLLSNY